MDHPLNEAAASAIARYGAIVGGVLIGIAARYGLNLNEGRPLTWKSVIADLLLFGMLGLISIAISDWLALTGNARVLVGALAGASGERLVRLARDAFMQKAKAQLSDAVIAAPGASIVPAGHGEPESVCSQPGTPDKPVARAANALKAGYGPVRRPPADQIELLRQLDP